MDIIKNQESAEDYLETILLLIDKQKFVRSIDIVNEMGFSKPSVSVAMKNLRNKELIEIDSKGYILLTDEGRKIAEYVYERHTILTKGLILLGVNEDVAKSDACRLEHYLSDESFNKIRSFINKQIK